MFSHRKPQHGQQNSNYNGQNNGQYNGQRGPANNDNANFLGPSFHQMYQMMQQMQNRAVWENAQQWN